MSVSLLAPVRLLLPSALQTSSIFVRDDGTNRLDDIYYGDLEVVELPGSEFRIDCTVVVDGELAIPLPGLPTLALVVAPATGDDDSEVIPGLSQLSASLTFDPLPKQLVLHDFVLGLRMTDGFLRPPPDANSTANQVTITTRGTITIGGSPVIRFSGFRSVSLPRCVIGDTGIIISADKIQFDNGDDQLSIGKATVEFPPDLPIPNIEIRNCLIGAEGFSGELTADWDLTFNANAKALEGGAVIRLFQNDQLQLGLDKVDIAFKDSALTRFNVSGKMILPFFDAKPVSVSIGIAAGGSFGVTLTDLGIELDRAGLFKIAVNGVALQKNSEETAISVTGDFQLTAVDAFPKVGLKGFTVFKRNDDPWDFRVEGAKFEINKSINFLDVVRLDVKSIGFGKRGDWNTITLSATAAIGAVDASLTVDGLRIPWKIVNGTPDVGTLTLDGLGVKGQIPNTVAFDGYVRWGGAGAFEGNLTVHLIPSEIDIGAGFKVGKTPECRYAFFTAFVNWPPPGIPLGCLPLYLVGAKGLIGINMRPDADEITDFFPLSMRPPSGLAQPSKWKASCDSHALGLGVRIATVNPRILNLDALFTFVYPELLLLIEGHAFVLQLPEPGKEPPFHALMAFDLDEPTALINVSGKYEFLQGVIKAEGMTEAYYGPKPGNPSQTTYRIALGEKNRPISAKVLQLFQANSYFVIEPGHWQLGSGIGLPKKSYSFSFASVHFEAYAGGDGEIFWGPTQLNGHLRLAGEAGFRIFKKGFDLSLGADVVGKTPDWFVDAQLWFGVKFKILWKKFKFGGTIPFTWQSRHTPPIPELLKSVTLKHAAIDADAAPLVLTGTPASADQGLDLALVPDVDPDTYPAIAFHYPTKDATGLPFAQNVTVVPNHTSGDHEFEAILKGPGSQVGIEMFRKKLDGTTDWVAFEATPPASPAAATDDKAYLYGAWQAAEGGEGANLNLHLFARSPFEYAEPVHTKFTRVATLYGEVLVTGTTAYSVTSQAAQVQAIIQNAASGALPNAGSNQTSGPAVKIPLFVDQPLCIGDLRARNTTLPGRVDQYRVNEDPQFPHSGATVAPGGKITPAPELAREECRNFLKTAVGFRGPYDVIAVDQEILGPPVSDAADVYVGGYGEFIVLPDRRVRRLGTCEIVEVADAPYPMRYFEWHCDRGIGPKTGKLLSQQRLRRGVLSIMLRHATKRLTIHYEAFGADGVAREVPCADSLPCPRKFIATRKGTQATSEPLWCQGTYQTKFGPENFWKDTEPLTPGHKVDLSQPGRLVITRSDRAFNKVVFNLARSVRIYSIYYEVDVTDDVKAADAQLESFMNLTWPNRHASGTNGGNSGGTWCGTGSGGSGVPGGAVVGLVPTGPCGVDLPRYYTPFGPIVPGYLYRVNVRTSHRRVKESPHGPNEREYRAYFKVSHPPSDLKPYVGATFPAPDSFPHYRAHELYLRTNRNYVHKLFGSERVHVTCELRGQGPPVLLPFRDDLDLSGATTAAALQAFATSTALDRRGWAWGKANGHEPTREETAWIESYNLTVPADRQIIPAMGLPDDVLWAYPVNPVLWREQFTQAAIDAIPSFDVLVDPPDALVTGRWSTASSLLHHLPAAADAPPSFLLGTAPVTEGYVLACWLRPLSTGNAVSGKVSLVLAAADVGGTSLGQYLAVQFDLVAQRLSLLQRLATHSPEIVVQVDRPFVLPRDRWNHVFVRVTVVEGQVAITVDRGGEQIVTALTDLSSAAGKVGFLASADYKGDFDNLEVLALDRLAQLPAPDMRQQLVVQYNNLASATAFDMYKLDFVASHYLDLFDHLNSWDRNVWRIPCQADTNGTCTNVAGDVASRVSNWVTANTGLLDALGQVALFERRYATKLCSLEELDAVRTTLRERRFELDDKFSSVATGLGFEISAKPERFEFFVSPDGKGVLVECPEPIDWTRIGAVALINGAGNSLDTKLLYSSDFTRAILYLPTAGQNLQPGVVQWTVAYLPFLPDHLSWLTGWLDHRREEYTLTLDIPAEITVS